MSTAEVWEVNQNDKIFLALVDMYKPHIIHATETHLDKQISNAELVDPLPEADLEEGVRGVRPPPPKIRKTYVIQR